MDLSIFRFLNGLPETYAPFLHFFSEATSFLWFKVFLVLLVLGMVIRGPKSRLAVFQALTAFLIANGMTDVFKHALPMHRPYQELAKFFVHPLGNAPLYGTSTADAANFGTASAHSANMAAIAFVLTIRLKWWGTPWIAAAILTGISRVYLAAHYPYQVLLGWTCGVTAGLLVTKAFDYFNEHPFLKNRLNKQGSSLNEPVPGT